MREGGPDMDRVTLWHGTTREAAERIAAEGSGPLALAAIVADVASEFDVDPAEVIRALEDHHRIAVTDGRSDRTWFAASRDAAAGWAQRAPEARWEALWGVWWVLNDPDEWAPWAIPDVMAWHVRQLVTTQPAIVVVRVDPRDVCEVQGKPDAAEHLKLLIEIGAPELSINRKLVPGDVVDIEVIPRRVPFSAAAGLLGVTIEELTRAVDAGALPRPRPAGLLEDWYWHLDDLPVL